jgi:nucleoside-diphosphate-sugar epimerase
LVQDISSTIEGEFDNVIHAASGFLNDVDMFNASFFSNKRCIEIASQNNCPLVYISSTEVYAPIRTYGIMKLAGEFLVKTYLYRFIIRPYHIYGPRMNPNDGRIQSEIIKELLNKKSKRRGDGSAIRTFTHVNDLIDALILVLAKGTCETIYDVTNELEETTII